MLLAALWAGACAPPPEAPSEEPLRIGLHAAPSLLDPHLQSEAAAMAVLGNVYDHLLEFDAEMRLQPGLAIHWSNPEDRVWRLALRPDVRFHDGSAFDADDVVFSLERARNLPGSRNSGFLVEVESVRAVDAHMVEIRTRRPYSLLPLKLALIFIVPEGAPERIEQPVGTGPYRVVAHNPGRKVTLEANPGGWNGVPPEPRVEIWFLPDSEERIGALLDGEVEWVNDVPPARFDALSDTPRIRTQARAGLQLIYLQTRPDTPPFDDPRVRRALSLAVDRQALVETVLAGQGWPTGQMAGPQIFGSAPDLEAPLRDLEEARRQLREAGHGEGNVAVELEYRAARNPGLAEALQRQLQEAGFAVTLRPRPWEEMYPRLYSAVVPFYVGGWVFLSGDASDLLDPKVHTREPETGYGDANTNGYSNPELDALIEASGAAHENLDRRRLLEQCLRRLAEDWVLIPLFVSFDLYAFSEDLQWQPRTDGIPPLSTMIRRREGEP